MRRTKNHCCRICGETNRFLFFRSKYYICKKCDMERMKNRKVKHKNILVHLLGGCCQACGYNEFNSVLEFHHVHREQKNYNIGGQIHLSLKTLKKEVDKCALLCGNCHNAFEYGDLKLVFLKREKIGYRAILHTRGQ